MNAAHLHLLLNHLPVLGTAFGLALLAWGLLKRSAELKRVSLGVLMIVTLLAVPAYLTGEPAEEVVENLPGVLHGIIEQHEGAAQIAFIAQVILGVGALGGLIAFRRNKLMPNWFAASVLAMSLVVSVLMARTAYLGGEIRHTEIRSGSVPAEHTDERAPAP